MGRERAEGEGGWGEGGRERGPRERLGEWPSLVTERTQTHAQNTAAQSVTYREEHPRPFLPLGERQREKAGRRLQAQSSRWLRRQVGHKNRPRGPAGGSVGCVVLRTNQLQARSMAGVHTGGNQSFLSLSPFLSL